jgi:hypothetical protein
MSAPATPPTSAELRKFGLLMAAIIASLFGLLLPWMFGRAWPKWPWIVTALFAVPATFAPIWLAPVHRAWMAIGAVLGWINSRILLAIVFYLVLVPMGFLMRLAGRDPMRRMKRGERSYRQPSVERPTEDMERPF